MGNMFHMVCVNGSLMTHVCLEILTPSPLTDIFTKNKANTEEKQRTKTLRETVPMALFKPVSIRTPKLDPLTSLLRNM